MSVKAVSECAGPAAARVSWGPLALGDAEEASGGWRLRERLISWALPSGADEFPGFMVSGRGTVKSRTKEAAMMSRSSIVTGVDFVSVATRDLNAAMDFYGNVLGLPRSTVWQRPGQEPVGAEFETGTVTIALIASERLGVEFQPNKVPIALRVDDVEAARAELESRGVAFNGQTIDSGVCHQALFEDPDGNVLDLHHRYAPR